MADRFDTRTFAGEASSPFATLMRVLARWRWLAIALIVLVPSAALVFAISQPKRYDATAELLVSTNDPTSPTEIGAGRQLGDPQRIVNNVVRLIRLDTVADGVRKATGVKDSNQELFKDLSTETEPNADLVEITYRDADPERAAAVATAFARELTRFRRDTAQARYREAARLAREQYEALPPEVRESVRGRQLIDEARRLEIEAALQTGGLEVVRAATTPTSAATPRPLLAAGVGLIAAVLLAIAGAFLLEFIGRRLKEPEEVERAFGLPIIASIPSRAGVDAAARDPAQREAFGTLAASLRFADTPDVLGTILVTSAAPSEGKTSVTLGLARALSALDLSVIVIEADLRRPSMEGYLGTVHGGGLGAVLDGTSTLERELTEVDGLTLRALEPGDQGSRGSFSVLPAGIREDNPQGLLSGSAMARVIDDARSLADVVLLDTAPAGVVNDPLTLVRRVDGVLVVSRYARTTGDEARRLSRLLEQLAIQPLGVVWTAVPGRAGGTYAYGAYAAAG